MDQAFQLLFSILILRLAVPKQIVTIYSGYAYPALQSNLLKHLALRLADYLIDGPFILQQANENLGYRGSHNQRVIDLKTTRKTSQISIVDWDNLIIIDNQHIATTPHLSQTLNLSGSAEECGKACKETL